MLKKGNPQKGNDKNHDYSEILTAAKLYEKPSHAHKQLQVIVASECRITKSWKYQAQTLLQEGKNLPQRNVSTLFILLGLRLRMVAVIHPLNTYRGKKWNDFGMKELTEYCKQKS